jgi:hypothetical protein
MLKGRGVHAHTQGSGHGSRLQSSGSIEKVRSRRIAGWLRGLSGSGEGGCGEAGLFRLLSLGKGCSGGGSIALVFIPIYYPVVFVSIHSLFMKA